MKFYMLVLALDTTTRRGSAALLRDGRLVDCEIGDASLTHGERLPGDLIRLLDRHSLTVGDIDLFAVAAGPGSFTGLRIGIAAMQGLALANSRRIVGIPTLNALNLAVEKTVRGPFLVAAWMDAQRGEVFGALFRGEELVDGPLVGKPDETLARWTRFDLNGNVTFAGDGALAYSSVIGAMLPNASILPDVPPLAPAIAYLAEQAAARNETLPPDDLRPLYVRRPDAELARDRRGSTSWTDREPRADSERHTDVGPRTGFEPTIASEPDTSAPPTNSSEPSVSPESSQHRVPRGTVKSRIWTVERTLSELDLDEIVAIEEAAFSNPWTRLMYLRELQNPDVSFLYVLRMDSRIAGFCSFWLVLDEIHINNLAIRREYQGHGLGSALLTHVLQAGASRGAERATLEVRRSNGPARRLYQSLGFEVAATRPNYYVSPPEDALILWKGGLNCVTFRP